MLPPPSSSSSAATNSSSRSVPAQYRFALELFDDSGVGLGDRPLGKKDFEAAIWATCFEGFRKGRLADYSSAFPTACILPRFAQPSGSGPSAQARIDGFEVAVSLAEQTYAQRFDCGYFRLHASRFRTQLLRDQTLTEQGTLKFQVSAYLDDHDAAAGAESPITVSPASVPLPIREVSRSDLGPGQTWDQRPADLLPVVLERNVVDDILAEAAAAPEREIGGFLLGHLSRDPRTQQFFLWITGSVAGADTTEGDGTSVTYTPETFALGRRMIQLRGEGEMLVGWYHSHPFRFCAECPLPTPPECVEKVLFYSADDIQLMESTFDQPYLVGLLAAVEPKLEDALGHPPIRLYGWQKGTIQQREFEVVESDSPDPPTS